MFRPLSLGEAAIHPVAIGLVGDHEHAGFGEGAGRGGKQHARNKGDGKSHETPDGLK
jgi:hypothetical protein